MGFRLGRTPTWQTIRTAAPPFDVHFVAPVPEAFERYVTYPVPGTLSIAGCKFARWTHEFSLRPDTAPPVHAACLNRVAVSYSLSLLGQLMPNVAKNLDTLAPKPIFVRGIGLLHGELAKDNPSVALEGGICLFQPGELLVEWDNGESGGHDLFYGRQTAPAGALQPDVSGLTCKVRRSGPSVQDYMHIYRLLAFASAVDAPAVVGIPDAEYTAEARRLLGSRAAAQSGVEDAIRASATQVTRLVTRIASRLKAEVVINSAESDTEVRTAMARACSRVREAGFEIPANREDILGYVAMPLTPKFLFGSELTLGVLPAAEARTVAGLAKAFPTDDHSFVLFPDMVPGTSDAVDEGFASAALEAAEVDLIGIIADTRG